MSFEILAKGKLKNLHRAAPTPSFFDFFVRVPSVRFSCDSDFYAKSSFLSVQSYLLVTRHSSLVTFSFTNQRR
jgi:hypothetical protein